MTRTTAIACGAVLLAWSFTLAGCPKPIPQPEIDAAASAMSKLEASKDCAPETYQAAKTMHDRAQALMKEERYEEAKTAFLAATRLAEKAAEECKKKKAADEEAARKKAEADALAAARAAAVPPPEAPAEGPAGMVTVYFGFNDAELSEDTRTQLAQNAEYLRLHAGTRVQVEGHCDARGSTEYNLSLGERRALTVKSYLIKLGVNPERLEIISYGEERPADGGSSEEAFARNRRAEFTPTSN